MVITFSASRDVTPGAALLASSDGFTPPPSQSGHGALGHDMSRWNPFGEDNFSRLTEEQLINREFDLLRASK
ncbi:BMP-2-inducible protein kinase [Liparis tanakae]|uniref:BMP-2-inducible protein kinase n=1 Tax=Liparis tanakae TaxID=230148 RepID=A0A4Z2F6P3_9TELE|nr:BMP-2-inducible protein kinase [Liparis tanakae]